MVRLNRIYTRTGDQGTAALGNGERRTKSDPRFAAIGEVDEANAAIGAARLHAHADLDRTLARVQNDLFDLGADLAVPEGGEKGKSRLRVAEAQVSRLEEELGVRLLHRTTRQLHLTDVGRLYFEGARAALHGLEEAASTASHQSVEPRGLVRLPELLLVGVMVGCIQLLLTLALAALHRAPGESLDLRLPALLLVTWIYFALMSREFFARRWLKAHPVIYLFSHMGIMPLVDWFATGCDWAVAGGPMPAGLFWFLAASFCNGLVIELGRKIRTPDQEEAGVETYTVLWGRPMATLAWLSAVIATLACAWLAAQRIAFATPFALVLGPLALAATILCALFIARPWPRLAKLFPVASGLWTLALYLTLGVVPLLLRLS